MKLKVLFAFVFLSVNFLAQAQNDTINTFKNKIWNDASLELMYQNGHVFATNDFLRGNNLETEKIKAFQVFSLKYSKQTKGKNSWEQLYKYPYWGVGIYVADFYNPEEVGVPIAIYGFLNAPFKRWEKLSFNYEIGFGATFNWRSFNPITNQYNVAIGAGESFLIDAGLNLTYALGKRIDIQTGFSLTHFSNGGIKKPNFGINTIAPKISLKYNFNDRPEFSMQDIPKFESKNELLISAFAGVKNVVYDTVNIEILEKYEGVFYAVWGISSTFNRQISYKSKIGVGMTLSYDGSVNAQLAVDNNEIEVVNGPMSDKLQLSIYPSYELVLNKVSLILQPAFYLYRKKLVTQSPVFHQRIGLKYHVSDKVFVGITLRDYAFHVSDYIEWTLGYRIF